MPSATIKLFLVYSDAKRLRTAELSNWTGKAVAGPRSELDGVLAREEPAKPGVYFLSGIDSEPGQSAVYVGEAESIRDRLRSHLDKDFWNHVVFFISKDEPLTKAHTRCLEGRLIEQAKMAGRALVMNGQSSGSKLPESDLGMCSRSQSRARRHERSDSLTGRCTRRRAALTRPAVPSLATLARRG